MVPSTYTVDIAGRIKRELPVIPISEKMAIASFVMFSDVELVVFCAEELLKRAPEFDVIVTAESKGIPLAYEMSRQSGKRYILARKFAKLYMKEPIEVTVNSITTSREQKLILDSDDVEYIRGKRVLIVDDVISTGGSVYGLEKLVHTIGGNIVGKCFALAEGDATERDDIIYLGHIPVFER